jgi:hypothetical protein
MVPFKMLEISQDPDVTMKTCDFANESWIALVQRGIPSIWPWKDLNGEMV